MKKKSCILLFVLMGILPTAFMFVFHDCFFPYDMNPLDFIICSLPAILATPFLRLDEMGGETDGH